MKTMGLAMCGALMFTWFVAGAQETPMPTITVTGSATVQGKPDVCYITLYATGDGILMVDAVKKADESAAKIEKAITDAHKDVKKIEVTQVALGEKERDFMSGDASEPPRPQVVRRLRIEIPPTPALAHEIIDTAIRAGALMKLQSERYYSDEPEAVVVYGLLDATALENEVRSKAVEDAKKQAAAIATALEGKAQFVLRVGGETESWSQLPRFSHESSDFPVKHFGTNPEQVDVTYAIPVTFTLRFP